MARYIDADKLIERIKPPQKEDDDSCVLLGDVRKILYDFVNEAPTADVVEVKHGKWDINGEVFQCSVCDNFAGYDYDYCPYCGTKMDGERK